MTIYSVVKMLWRHNLNIHEKSFSHSLQWQLCYWADFSCGKCKVVISMAYLYSHREATSNEVSIMVRVLSVLQGWEKRTDYHLCFFFSARKENLPTEILQFLNMCMLRWVRNRIADFEILGNRYDHVHIGQLRRERSLHIVLDNLRY